MLVTLRAIVPGVLGVAVVVGGGAARACPPPQPASAGAPVEDDCVDLVKVGGPLRHEVALSYGVGVTATAVGRDGVVAASTGADARYVAWFGGDRPSYQIDVGGGASLSRLAGSLTATGLSTRAHVHAGPAPVPPPDPEHPPHANISSLSFEIDHTGELAELPRLSSRPDVRRAHYVHQRVDVATRLIRMEASEDSQPETGSSATAAPVGPGGRKKASSYALDFITLTGSLDATVQDGQRLDGSIGGALLSVTARYTEDGRADVFALEHRMIRAPGGIDTAINIVWALRLELAHPKTGTRYLAGWGFVDRDSFLPEGYPEVPPPENGGTLSDAINIGGIGGWKDTSWGGWGVQYRRDPYITMAGERALDDRLSVETWQDGWLPWTSRIFVARTQRFAMDALHKDWTAGCELAARKEVGGIDATLSLEAGWSYYGALDDAAPGSVGKALRTTLTLARAGGTRWGW